MDAVYCVCMCVCVQDFRVKFPGAGDLALDLLRGMLRFDPADRLTAEEALQHGFFESLQQREYGRNYLLPPPGSPSSSDLARSPASFRPVPMNADIEKMGESAPNLWNNVSARTASHHIALPCLV